jgi:hypothetical protein
VYARRQRLSDEVIANATAIKVEAMALMGEMLKQTPKHKGGGDGSNQHKRATGSNNEPVAQPITYAQAGIGKKEASDAQVIATVKETKPELYAEIAAGKKKVSHARVELKREQNRQGLKAKVRDMAPPTAVYPNWLSASVVFASCCTQKACS